jgi:uncharacterized protein YhaN
VRLLELEIVGFGAIANRRIDLSRGDGALQLIYGPNEAGKSTTLRAILGLLFGIDHHSPDAKLFGSDALRLRAKLCDADGRVLAISRRKGSKNTLLDAADEPLDEAVLQRALGGLTAPVFRTMFGLDHERLRAGGEQLRLGQGDLGESLFQAGLGVSGLHEALGRLGKEAEELWKPRGQKPLNQAIEAHAQARKSVREHGKRAEAVRDQERELDAAREERGALQLRRTELQSEQSRLARALRVLPKLAQRRELGDKRAALGSTPQLPDDCEQLRSGAQHELIVCASQREQLERSLARLERSRAEMVIPESLLALSPEHVREIRNRLGSHLKAATDLPIRRAELRAHELDAAAALRTLGHPVAFEAVESLRVDTATQTRIAKLAREHSGRLERVEAAERGLQAAQLQLDKARADLDALPRASAEQGVAQPVASALPSESVVEAFRARFERLEQARARHEIAAQSLRDRDERVQTQLDRIAREGAPPTEADLLRVRAARDALLPQIRAALAGEISALPRLVLEFEALQQRADDTADRLRREAGRVAELSQLQAERDAIVRSHARLEHDRSELAAQADGLLAQWRRTWLPLAIVPLAPVEMRSLLARISGLLESGERDRTDALRRRAQAQQELDRWQRGWSELMGRLNLDPEASAEEAQAVVDELRRLFEKVDAMRQLRARIEAIERDAAQFEREVGALVARHLPELGGAPLEHAAEQLVRRYEQAQRECEQRERLEQELGEAQSQLADVRSRAAQAERVIAELLRLARVPDLEALAQAEQHWRQARELEQQLAVIEVDLFALGEGATLDELVHQASELGPDRMRARLEDIKDDLAAVDARRDELNHQIARLELGLESLRKGDLAAQSAAEAEQHLSRIKTLAHGYVRKRLAAELLRREIRRYRDANQGPIVGRASELFARLTLGRYPRLSVGYDDRDEPVLRCVDDAGRGIGVEALSDGTRDQLYLALRLSSLERFARHNPPMPLVLDDVLIHFDDERARAALAVLGELSATTQVLFFTHHKRLLELAREAIAKPGLCEHRLGEERLSPPMVQRELF